jgi:hypothetical protein
MPDQEYTQIHFDCAEVAANWLLRLNGDDVLKAREVLKQLEDFDSESETAHIFADCVDLMLCAIEDSRRASGEITSPRGTTMCELLEMIEANPEENEDNA